MNNFVKVGLTTGVVLSAIMPYGGVHAETEDLKVETKEDTFRTGNLTAPSQNSAENVAKDALKGKQNKHYHQSKLIRNPKLIIMLRKVVNLMMVLHWYVFNKRMKDVMYTDIN